MKQRSTSAATSPGTTTAPRPVRRRTSTVVVGALAIAATFTGGASTSVQAASGVSDRPTVVALHAGTPTEDSVLRHGSTRRQAGAAGSFAHPPRSTRPKMRWWWAAPLSATEAVAELRAIAAAGFGGVEIAYTAGAWGDAAQRSTLGAVLRAARELRMTVDMTMGAAWPVTTPDTGGDATSPFHSQELQYGAASVVGPGTYTLPAPPPIDSGVAVGFEPSGPREAGKLVAVVAARVTKEGTPVVFPVPSPPYEPVAPTAPVVSTELDRSSLVDLTSRVDDAGLVQFSPPEPGRWVVLAFWQRPTVQSVMNHFSAGAARTVTRYLDEHQIGTANADLLVPGSTFFEDSLELNFNGIPWTDGLQQLFRERRGYGLVELLPLLFVQNEWMVPGHDPAKMPNPDYDVPGVGARVRADFKRTLDELYHEQHMRVFQRWARGHGMSWRSQVAYGSPLDVTRAARKIATDGGYADTESRNAGDPVGQGDSNWGFALDFYRALVSGAHQGGEAVVSTELGGTNAREYMNSLSEYKDMMDKQWSVGVTRPIIHGYAYTAPGTAWPGRSQFGGLIAQSWNHEHFPEWSMWRRLNDYWARGTWVLEAGVPRTDVAVYRDDPTVIASALSQIPLMVLTEQVDPQAGFPVFTDADGQEQIGTASGLNHPSPVFDSGRLSERGYSIGYVDPDGLTDRRAAGRGVLYPSGPRYRAIVLDEDRMPGAAARALAAQARRGQPVVVVGTAPSHGTGLRGSAAEDRVVRASMRVVLRSARTKVVPTQQAVAGALARLGVRPTVALGERSTVLSQHRRTSTTDYFYLWNGETEPVSTDVSLAAVGAPSVLDLWTGSREPLATYRTAGGRTTVPVVLRPGQSMVLAVDRRSRAPLHVVRTTAESAHLRGSRLELRSSEGGVHKVALSSGRAMTARLPRVPRPLALAQWGLRVKTSEPDGNRVVDVALDELRDWRDVPELEGVSGTGTYTTRVRVPAAWVRAGRGAHLDLGEVHGTVEVRVNGRRVPGQATPDTTHDRRLVAPRLQRFDVSRHLRAGSNTIEVVLATTLKNAAVAEAQAGNSNVRSQALLSATQPYGLFGPVRLEPYARAFLRLGR